MDGVTPMQNISVVVEALKRSDSNRERIEILNQVPRVQRWLSTPSWLRTFSALLSEECELMIKSLIAIGQEDSLLLSSDSGQMDAEKLRAMLEDLFPVEAFYKEIGGVVGYHWTMFSFLSSDEVKADPQGFGTAQNLEVCSREVYHRPPGIDITLETDDVRCYILQGIVSLPLMGEIYPVGGAADRLNFCDPQSGQALPAARLAFNGHTLLEGLIRDVQAREYLYFKLFGEQVTTPIAMMTSSEKDNHRQILAICQENQWFGRPKEAFRFFCQPLVPTMDKMGNWCLKGTLKLLMKPGGHGVIWKAAKDEGIFDWFESLNRTKVLVRQINNPIAGVDHGILAFCGVGFSEDKVFGFASCPRQVQSAEGVNILIEKKFPSHSDYCLTNIEYCDFSRFAIQDIPELGSVYSQFPSNTNILFADIAAVRETVKHCPIPGMLVNLKKISFTDEKGQLVEQEVARLESTMQNIADCFKQSAPSSLPHNEVKLNTYLTYNHRRKTISTTKKLLQAGSSLLETPEGCFYDLLQNAHDLLSNYCKVVLPPIPDTAAYIEEGPSFLFLYHPAMGPLYSIIAQKIRGGKFERNSELKLEIAEVDIANLTLMGSLHVIADQIVGEKDAHEVLHYSDQVGRCRLINVTVENQGYDLQASSFYWKGEVSHWELCQIVIHGNGEFCAENITLHGHMKIEVESGTRLTAYEEQGALKFKKEPLSGPVRSWIYHFTDEGAIFLE